MSQKMPSFLHVVWVSLILSLVGAGGLAFVITRMEPDPGPRWLFFFLLMLVVSGLALPVTYFFNLRFPTDPPLDSGVVIREAVWVGIYVSVLAWLQLGRVLTSGLALALAAGLILIEILLRLGERSAWSPARPSPGTAGGEDEEEDEEEEDD